MSVFEIVPLLLSFLLGMCVMSFAAYLRAKRKNETLREEGLRLADKQPTVSVGDRTETDVNELARAKSREVAAEAIKKRFTVSIAKSECQYDEKRPSFMDFFTLLDEFHRKNNAIFTLQFHPIMNRFLASNSAEDDIARNRAILEFNREVQALFTQLYEEQQKVNSETDSIRSFSSDTLGELLDKLESAVKQSTADSAEILKFMATQELWADRSLALPLEKAENSMQLVLTCRNAVRSRMKVELDVM